MKKKHSKIFNGVATALITPFRSGEIDYNAMGRIIDLQIDSGIAALVICGTTGEASTLSVDEHLNCIDFAVERVNKRIPVIAGCGSNCMKKASTLARGSYERGADALLAVTPYYNKASESGLIEYFTKLADTTPLPMLLYNVPSRTGVSISLDTYMTLARHDNIVGVKEAGGNISQIAHLAASAPNGFDIYSGNDDMTLPVLSLGGSGVISVVSNVLPREMSELCDAFFNKRIGTAQKLQHSLMDMIHVLFCEVNPIPVKYAMHLMGLCTTEIRLPLTEPSEKTKQLIQKALCEYHLT